MINSQYSDASHPEQIEESLTVFERERRGVLRLIALLGMVLGVLAFSVSIFRAHASYEHLDVYAPNRGYSGPTHPAGFKSEISSDTITAGVGILLIVASTLAFF